MPSVRSRLTGLRLWRKEHKLKREYRELRKKIGSNKASMEQEMELDELNCGLIEIEEERYYLYHQSLVHKANKLFLPVPPYTGRVDDDMWDQLPITGYHVLSQKGIKDLRNQLREELKARREWILGWIAPFVGIVGTLLGFLHKFQPAAKKATAVFGQQEDVFDNLSSRLTRRGADR